MREVNDHVTEEDISVSEQNVAVVEANIEVGDYQEPIEKQKMSDIVGNIGQFDEGVEQWSSYT